MAKTIPEPPQAPPRRRLPRRPSRACAPAPTSASTRSRDIAAGLATLLADAFALYLKTKNFHWHMSGPHFRDYHLLLDEQADQIFAMTDAIAERARKIGGTTLRSIGHIARAQRLPDNDADYVTRRTCWRSSRATTGSSSRPCAACTRLRRAQRRGDRQPDRELDRRDRAPRLVPFRGHPDLAQHHLLTAGAVRRLLELDPEVGPRGAFESAAVPPAEIGGGA